MDTGNWTSVNTVGNAFTGIRNNRVGHSFLSVGLAIWTWQFVDLIVALTPLSAKWPQVPALPA